MLQTKTMFNVNYTKLHTSCDRWFFILLEGHDSQRQILWLIRLINFVYAKRSGKTLKSFDNLYLSPFHIFSYDIFATETRIRNGAACHLPADIINVT